MPISIQFSPFVHWPVGVWIFNKSMRIWGGGGGGRVPKQQLGGNCIKHGYGALIRIQFQEGKKKTLYKAFKTCCL